MKKEIEYSAAIGSLGTIEHLINRGFHSKNDYDDAAVMLGTIAAYMNQELGKVSFLSGKVQELEEKISTTGEGEEEKKK
jgi:hypothetical protein